MQRYLNATTKLNTRVRHPIRKRRNNWELKSGLNNAKILKFLTYNVRLPTLGPHSQCEITNGWTLYIM